jgi:site-specific DNA-methyltransferase (adenine-specific)
VKRIIQGDNAQVLPSLPAQCARLIYIDPPFNTGKRQQRTRITSVRSESGSRVGFGGRRYESTAIASASYRDSFDDFVGFLLPHIELSLRCLTDDGSIFVHVDPRESHYVKVALDQLLGRDSFMNEIIWAYDYGGRPKTRWPAKHDSILWYARDPKRYVYNYDAIDRIPYMAPGLVTEEKRARGKTPTDVWWNTIVPTMSKEKTGYPTQKPIAILNRIVRVHSDPGDVVLDYFAGSGTTGEAAAINNRGFILIDESKPAVDTMKKRLARFDPTVGR